MTMATSLVDALETNDTQTENGMPAHSTTGKACVDLFFQLGASRNLGSSSVLALFHSAFQENRLLALRNLFYTRDVRAGQGERNTFRVILRWLGETHPEEVRHLVHLVPVYGRWDDLFVLLGTTLEDEVLTLVEQALLQNDALCAKWVPRKGPVNEKIRTRMGMTPKEFRKFIVARTKVVETQMCQGAWGDINYSHVPSKAANLYRKAFSKHDCLRYGEYLAALTRGDKTVKVNAKAIFPHDIIKNYRTPDPLVEAQWKAQPNYLQSKKGGASKRVLPVCDVSGSMYGLPLEVCLALGVYLAERNEGPFKDRFITFSQSPKLQRLQGATVCERIQNLNRAQWDMNTNLEKVWELILGAAVRHQVPESEMPTDVVIFSDMQFDQCAEDPPANVMTMIRKKYEAAGYRVPTTWFWNLRATSNVPVKYTEAGVALVSGFSPSILTQVLSGDVVTPLEVALKTLNSERYQPITLRPTAKA